MAVKLEVSFRAHFKGVVWKTLAHSNLCLLVVETRDPERKQVRFSLVDLQANIVRWEEIGLEEDWWVTLEAVGAGMALVTHYPSPDNPDQKNLFALNLMNGNLQWWRNAFSVTQILTNSVVGRDLKFQQREIVLDIETGSEMSMDLVTLSPEQNFTILRPFQYRQGTAHFETVSHFLQEKCQISPVISVEYLEHGSLILVSVFLGAHDLANYLFVFNTEGELLMKELLGEHLTGIATDTFFVYGEQLIFIKNKRELLAYKVL